MHFHTTWLLTKRAPCCGVKLMQSLSMKMTLCGVWQPPKQPQRTQAMTINAVAAQFLLLPCQAYPIAKLSNCHPHGFLRDVTTAVVLFTLILFLTLNPNPTCR